MTISSKYGSQNSKYCYPNTNILVNLLNIKDEKLLDDAEALLTTQRLIELQIISPPDIFDLEYLMHIHLHIFQDLYSFAGKFREEDIIYV